LSITSHCPNGQETPKTTPTIQRTLSKEIWAKPLWQNDCREDFSRFAPNGFAFLKRPDSQENSSLLYSPFKTTRRRDFTLTFANAEAILISITATSIGRSPCSR
jgi:hypothetical protein